MLAALALLAQARAADSFSCGSRVIATGMSDREVREACGEPAEIRRESILRRPTVWIQGRPYPVSSDPVEVPVERWLYNFGPSRLMRRLRFDDGVLVEVTTLGYGSDP